MGVHTKETSFRDTKMVQESTYGQIKGHFTRANGSTISFREEGILILLIIESIMVISKITCFMEMGCIYGLMVQNIQVSFVSIKNMGKGFMNGVMAENIRGDGAEALGKDRACIYFLMDIENKAYGGQIKE